MKGSRVDVQEELQIVELVKSVHSLEKNTNEEMTQAKGFMENKVVGSCP